MSRHTQEGFSMRVSISGAAGLAALGLLTLAPTGASAQKAEFALLGNKLWNTHSQVLARQGQPTRIEIGATAGGPAAPAGGGMMSSGGMSSGGGGPMGASASNNPGMAQQMQASMSRMMRGGGGGKMGGGGGLPGMGMGIGGDQGEGMATGPARAGSMGMGGGQMGINLSGGQGGGSGSSDEGEITWVYDKGLLTNFFLFNKDGRLIQVSSFGYSGGGAVTSRGLRLGDSIGKVYAQYGWTPNITKDDTRGTMTLDYSKDHHVAFQLAEKNKVYHVVGITIGISELGQLQDFAPGTNFNARRAGGTMGGGMMGGGMGGGSSSGMMRGRAGGGGGGGSAMKAAN
jgi:hypothetical protein